MYPEQRTAHFKNVVNITVNSDSVIPQQKQNGSEKDCQAGTYNENEANKSIEEITSKTIEQNARNRIEQIVLENKLQLRYSTKNRRDIEI